MQFIHLIALAAVLLALPGTVLAQPGNDQASPGTAALQARYQTLRPQLEHNVFGVPIYLEADDRNGVMRGDVYAVIEHPYRDMASVLSTPTLWCEIISVHLNIKACTHRMLNGETVLTIYSGRKFYEVPEDTYRLEYIYALLCAGTDYCKMSLTAEDGPMDTSDYAFEVAATPVDNGRTFVHFRYSYRYGLATGLATSGYLSTLGRNKIGFTVTGTDVQGEPIYIGGVRGVIERNAMRYYLAIKAFMDTRKLDKTDRFEARIGLWFDLTEKYAKQLNEMSRSEYLAYKRQERADQLRLQRAVDDERR